MDKLSNEVLSLIFNHLSQHQKLQCMLVSRSWARIIYSGPMLETIVISNGSLYPERRFNKLIGNIEADSIIGRRCYRLVLDSELSNQLDRVIALFPNLKFLYLSSKSDKQNTCKTSTNQNAKNVNKRFDQSWKENLRTFIGHDDTGYVSDLLRIGVFRKLTTLVLGPHAKYLLLEQFFEISKALKNTPALTTLSIQQTQISISGLEQLHDNTPELTTLVLTDCLWMLTDETPSIIQPAKKMKTFKVLDSSFGLPLDMAHYIILKYTDLECIYFTVDKYTNALRTTASNQLITSFIHIVGSDIGPKLSTFRFNAPVDVSNILIFLSQHNACLEDLQVNVNQDDLFTNEIALLDCCHNLSTLSLMQVARIHFEQFECCTNLKSLELAFAKRSNFHIDLNKATFHLPASIETLKLANVKLAVNAKDKWYDSSIKSLKLNRVKTTKSLPKYLSMHAPKLESLSLQDCQLTTPFELPEHHLHFIEIVMPEKFTRYDGGWNIYALERVISTVMHLKTTIGNTTRYYLYQKNIFSESHPLFTQEYLHDLAIHNTCTPTYFDENLPHFHFKCASARLFYYNGYILL